MRKPLSDERDNNFNLLRAVLATLVLLGHAYEMAYNDRSHEPFAVFTHTATSLGDVAVCGFFLISGFLILKSWLHSPRLGTYLSKRALRIIPGYFVAAILSTIIVGWIMTHSAGFFRDLGKRYIASLLLLDSPLTPHVFPGKIWDFVDGSLWTIKYEFRCYLLIALAGLAGAFRRTLPWLLLTALAFAVGYIPAIQQHLQWHRWMLPLGNPAATYSLVPPFLCGGCFYLLWHRIPRRPWIALLAACALVPALFNVYAQMPVLILCGGYLLFYFAFLRIPALDFFKHAPDLSYGIYLYGWPVEALWTWFFRTPPWITFLGSFAICLPLAWLSWTLIERPALLLKPKGSVPVPDAAPRH